MSLWGWAVTITLTAYGIGMITGRNFLRPKPSGRRSGGDRRKSNGRPPDGVERRSEQRREPRKKSNPRTPLYMYLGVMAVLIIAALINLVTE